MVAPMLPLTMHAATVHRRGKALLGPVDLSLGAQGFTIVLGPNGAGKTTLLRSLHGLERLSGGALEWQVSDAEAQARTGFVFQSPTMLRRSVAENLAYPLLLKGVARAQAAARARKIAARIALDSVLNQPAARLSGGEKQKLALGRALICKPDLLLLDEPCSNLDGRATREIEALLLEAQSAGMRIIMATHNLGQARRLASDVVFLHKGKALDVARAKDFFEGAKSAEAAAFLRGDIVE